VISSPIVYLLTLALVATFFSLLEKRTSLKVFDYVPAVVMIYASSMVLASLGAFDYNEEVNKIYSLTKTNLLPAMLFLMLLQVDLRSFVKLGKSLLTSYVLALLSLGLGFILVAYLFAFDKEMASAFGALAGSWTGGTANMIAVGSALEVEQEAFGYALIVDSINYTFWVMFLLFLVPFAKFFNQFTQSEHTTRYQSDIGCACTVGAKKYWLLIALSLLVSYFTQTLAHEFSFINKTTTIVLIATLMGVIGSYTKLRELNGSSEIANTMLFIIVALIGSKAVFDSFSNIGVYIFAGFSILLIHAFIMFLGAKFFKLDLFSVAVASLSNIGGVASAPILAAAYNKSLVSVGVLMAIMGYLIGTFAGLFIGNILIGIAR